MLVALRVAYLPGFRRIYLLSCDFQMDEKHRYWFDEERTATAIRNNTNSHRILTGYFEQLKPIFERAGFQVFNCNPDSRLNVFPFADLDTALREAECARPPAHAACMWTATNPLLRPRRRAANFWNRYWPP